MNLFKYMPWLAMGKPKHKPADPKLKKRKCSPLDSGRPDRTITDQRGRKYMVMLDGHMIRLSPARPWNGKAERRQVIKHRREVAATV